MSISLEKVIEGIAAILFIGATMNGFAAYARRENDIKNDLSCKKEKGYFEYFRNVIENTKYFLRN